MHVYSQQTINKGDITRDLKAYKALNILLGAFCVMELKKMLLFEFLPKTCVTPPQDFFV